ncbi:MAG: 1-acyl-sn-glycerol-3-phosphate acyltransferase [Cytophagales bacterium]|nr:MAG: 1-acyl-sn-glycerol-3-phosphate acyltransferase [Cytophagales bacterium]
MLYIIGWITTILFAIPFLMSLVIFHGIQVITLNLFGYHAHKKTLDYLQATILGLLYITGFRLRINRWHEKLPTDRPLILVSNHQSIFDIPMILWALRRHHPKFVAKKELGRGIPSVSYHLRHGHNVLIDRKDKDQALQAIGGLGTYIEKYNRSAVIYPEGSRSRDGILREFKINGVAKLLETAPSALVVPLAIKNSWKIVRYGFKPIPFGTFCELNVLEPIDPKNLTPEEVMKIVEERIRICLGQVQTQITQS